MTGRDTVVFTTALALGAVLGAGLALLLRDAAGTVHGRPGARA